MDEKKLLVLGLDGATWKLLEPWAKKGELPVFGKLMREGSYRTLQSTIPPHTCPAHPSLYTGKNSDKIGAFGFQKSDGSFVTYKDIGRNHETLWELLEGGDYRCFIGHLKVTHPPPEDIKGAMISGLEATRPEGLKEELSGLKELTNEFNKAKELSKENVYRWRLRVMEEKYRVFKKIVGEKNFDFSVLWLSSTDWVQHWYWNDKEVIRKCYERIEDILRDILDSDWKNLFVISDHGFRSAPFRNFHLDAWLEEKGFLKTKFWSRPFSYLQKFIKHPFIFNHMVRPFLQVKKGAQEGKVGRGKGKERQNRKTVAEKISGIDMDQSVARAYFTGGLDIHLQGVEILEENIDDYEQARDKIIEGLQNLRDEEGRKVVKGAWRRENLFNVNLSKIPDVVLLPAENYRIAPLPSSSIYSKTGERKISGVHDREGIFLAHGADISGNGELEKAKLWSIMPTILHMYDLPVPTDLDGQVLRDIFSKESKLAREPVRRKKPRLRKETSQKIAQLKTDGKI